MAGKAVGKILSNAGAEGSSSILGKAVEKVKSGGRKYVDALRYDTQNAGSRISANLEKDSKKLSHNIGKAKRENLSDGTIKSMQQKHAKMTATRKSLDGVNDLDSAAEKILDVRSSFNGDTFGGQAKTLASTAGTIANDYFWDGATKGQRAARIGTAAGAVTAGNVGVRVMSGGSLTYNSKGERDIVGIPFM